MSEIAIVGIDLGTTTTECAYFDRNSGQIESLQIKGSDIMKSALLFKGNICQVGNDTQMKIRGDLISITKRIIGFPFRSLIVQRELKHLKLRCY